MQDYFPIVADEELKCELNITYEYILWMLTSEAFISEENQNIFLHLKKDILVHCGAVVEGMLFYVAKEFYDARRIVFTQEELKEVKRCYTITEEDEKSQYVAVMEKITKPIQIRHIEFKKMIDALYQQKILDT